MSFLISFEGIDGCGKSTQINLLKNELENRDISNCILREPGDTSISDKIREILLDKENNICAESETLLFLAARAQLVREKILPELEKGSLVICDRYYDSTLAYQGYGRNLDRSLINNLNKFAINKMIPLITFILKLDPEIAFRRISKNEVDRMESGGLKFLQKVQKGNSLIAKSFPNRCYVINCKNKDKLTIHSEIMKTVNKYI